eukprot:11211116-Lingulodinium_polyedra.AAC.1
MVPSSPAVVIGKQPKPQLALCRRRWNGVRSGCPLHLFAGVALVMLSSRRCLLQAKASVSPIGERVGPTL